MITTMQKSVFQRVSLQFLIGERKTFLDLQILLGKAIMKTRFSLTRPPRDGARSAKEIELEVFGQEKNKNSILTD